MEWTLWNWFSVAGIAALCGSVSAWLTVVLVAEVRNWSTKSALDTYQRRLTDCESLQSELVAALGRIEARDRMRQVRAGKSSQPPSPPNPEPEAQSGQPAITTAELRRQLAARQLLRS